MHYIAMYKISFVFKRNGEIENKNQWSIISLRHSLFSPPPFKIMKCNANPPSFSTNGICDGQMGHNFDGSIYYSCQMKLVL